MIDLSFPSASCHFVQGMAQLALETCHYSSLLHIEPPNLEPCQPYRRPKGVCKVYRLPRLQLHLRNCPRLRNTDACSHVFSVTIAKSDAIADSPAPTAPGPVCNACQLLTSHAKGDVDSQNVRFWTVFASMKISYARITSSLILYTKMSLEEKRFLFQHMIQMTSIRRLHRLH